MDLPDITPFRKKVLSPHCHGSAAPLSTMAPPPHHCDDVLSGVPPATSGLVPTMNFPHEAPPTLPDVPHAKLGLVQSESLPDVHQQIQETMEHEPAPFVPSMGAWSKPLVLNFPPPSTPPEPSTPHSYDFQLKKSLLKGVPPLLPNLPASKLPPPELKDDGSLRFPLAAKMNPTSKNLFLASRPTFRLDGTPEIIIPAKSATSPKDSFIAFEHLSPSAKSTSASTLAGTDPTNTTPHSTKFIQEHVNMESDFHINEQMGEYGSVLRGGWLLKPTQRYQEMKWHTVRGRGNRGRGFYNSFNAYFVYFTFTNYVI
ncbi:hypothetical protein DY000_02026332 [Brassica cretica]|uniref:Uncharacterized protein n=1 Tax=Brassica cretica TaxID=69181 RepID=A0ABQ7EHM0_BRACR|nr:hypothetical protein DY000_02026332 [Brassica cretica]